MYCSISIREIQLSWVIEFECLWLQWQYWWEVSLISLIDSQYTAYFLDIMSKFVVRSDRSCTRQNIDCKDINAHKEQPPLLLGTSSWQTTHVFWLLPLSFDVVIVSLSRVKRDCVSGGIDCIDSWNDRFFLRNIASMSLISFASSTIRFSSVTSRDEIRVAAFSWAAAAASRPSRSTRSVRSASHWTRSLS